MLHQAEEERQILALHPLLVEREDVAALRGVEQVVAVLDALGDALAGHHLADLVLPHEGAELVVGNFGIDGHQAVIVRQ